MPTDTKLPAVEVLPDEPNADGAVLPDATKELADQEDAPLERADAVDVPAHELGPWDAAPLEDTPAKEDAMDPDASDVPLPPEGA